MATEFNLQRHVFGPALALSLWSWSHHVFKPALVLKLGLYRPQTLVLSRATALCLWRG